MRKSERRSLGSAKPHFALGRVGSRDSSFDFGCIVRILHRATDVGHLPYVPLSVLLPLRHILLDIHHIQCSLGVKIDFLALGIRKQALEIPGPVVLYS